jgi:hypothetical protein
MGIGVSSMAALRFRTFFFLRTGEEATEESDEEETDLSEKTEFLTDFAPR